MNATKTKPKAAPRLRKLPQGYVFKPVVDEKGRRRFDKELVLLLRTRSDNYKILQTAWQNDPDVIAWCIGHHEHWVRLVREYGYNKSIERG